jgi:hypothetical protein
MSSIVNKLYGITGTGGDRLFLINVMQDIGRNQKIALTGLSARFRVRLTSHNAGVKARLAPRPNNNGVGESRRAIHCRH